MHTSFKSKIDIKIDIWRSPHLPETNKTEKNILNSTKYFFLDKSEHVFGYGKISYGLIHVFSIVFQLQSKFHFSIHDKD